jgi:hypothetical protein
MMRALHRNPTARPWAPRPETRPPTAGRRPVCWAAHKQQVTGSRSWWAKHMHTVNGLMAAGAVVGHEDAGVVCQHILDVIREPVRLLGKWDRACTIAPGVHLHATEVGAQLLAEGRPLTGAMLTGWKGRDRTLAGEVPYLVLPVDTNYRTDMKARWMLMGSNVPSPISASTAGWWWI